MIVWLEGNQARKLEIEGCKLNCEYLGLPTPWSIVHLMKTSQKHWAKSQPNLVCSICRERRLEILCDSSS